LAGVADNYSSIVTAWNTLPESYQRRVYEYTLVTAWCQTQKEENPMPAIVISMEVVHVDNAIPLEYMTFNVALEEPEIRNTDTKITIYNNCTDNELYFGMQRHLQI
jgi:hypothetical protein